MMNLMDRNEDETQSAVIVFEEEEQAQEALDYDDKHLFGAPLSVVLAKELLGETNVEEENSSSQEEDTSGTFKAISSSLDFLYTLMNVEI